MIRPETEADQSAVRAVHMAAFPTHDESRLVDALRSSGRLAISLVAEAAGRVVGHVAFSPVALAGAADGYGLGPLAVLPEFQRRGLGGQLTRRGLDDLQAAGAGFVVVLGDPHYYGRFGFRRASLCGLASEYDADEAFQVMELCPGALPSAGGLVRYAPEFRSLPGPETESA